MPGCTTHIKMCTSKMFIFEHFRCTHFYVNIFMLTLDNSSIFYRFGFVHEQSSQVLHFASLDGLVNVHILVSFLSLCGLVNTYMCKYISLYTTE